ncbi:MAG: hypothetical protein ABIQ74_09490 [Chitinophagales bacterium]
MLGKIALVKEIPITPGLNTTSLDFEGQSSGIYLCKIVIDGSVQEAKIIKE